MTSPDRATGDHWRSHIRNDAGRTKESPLVAAKEEAAAFFNRLRLMCVPPYYYLLDGNHRSLAAAFCGRKIRALELEREEDLPLVRTMVQKGTLFEFPHENLSLQVIANMFERYCARNLEGTTHLLDRAIRLAGRGAISEHMMQEFLQSHPK